MRQHRGVSLTSKQGDLPPYFGRPAQGQATVFRGVPELSVPYPPVPHVPRPRTRYQNAPPSAGREASLALEPETPAATHVSEAPDPTGSSSRMMM